MDSGLEGILTSVLRLLKCPSGRLPGPHINNALFEDHSVERVRHFGELIDTSAIYIALPHKVSQFLDFLGVEGVADDTCDV